MVDGNFFEIDVGVGRDKIRLDSVTCKYRILPIQDDNGKIEALSYNNKHLSHLG